MLKVAITHDVDRTRKTFQYFTKSMKHIVRLDMKRLSYQVKSLLSASNPYWNFEPLMELEQSFGVRSTFFFLDESIKLNLYNLKSYYLALGRYNIEDHDIVNVIQQLDLEGWEIGVHGSYASYNNLDLLRKEKQKLERIVGHDIIGIRQHHLNFCDQTWEIHRDLGFKYDSTWGHAYDIGFKDNKVSPFKPFNDKFLVFPMTIMDTPFCESINKWERLKEITKIVKENSGILVLNWHSDSFNDKEFPYYRSDFIKILEFLKSQDAVFKPLGGFYNETIT